MGDIDDLQAAFAQSNAAVNRRDLEALRAMFHDEAVQFGSSSPFPREGKAAFLQAFETIFANYEGYTFTPINPQFRVIGTTGVVWAHFAVAQKPKDGPMTTLFGRAIWTFAKSDGQWLIVAAHLSRLPSGN
jgi:uncharacterized protein (TIGR02246 family)